MSPRALVSFVGAGPGDPELITLKALRRVRAADVIIHDRLIPMELLDEARADAEILDGGKAPGRQCLGQSEINWLLVDRARRGRIVVRLKGGDPFVLGRGPSNFTTFEPRGSPELLPIGQQAEPETPVNREGITQAVVGMPLAGNAQGMIPAFGVYLTRMYADYYNRISFAFERELIGVSGRTGIEVASGLFIR
jgi:hypothetical protein